MQEKIIEIKTNGLQESFTLGKTARQTDGSVLYRQGKTVILATVVASDKAVHEPFLPLTVQYIEKAYAAAKIPGGFVKRESKPSDFETLTARIVDRSLRPLFPEDFAYPTVITVMVLSADPEVDLQVAALHAANAALLVSTLPVERSIAAVRLGRIEGERRLNPTRSEMEESALDLLLVGSGEELLMIEMAAKATEVVEIEEDQRTRTSAFQQRLGLFEEAPAREAAGEGVGVDELLHLLGLRPVGLGPEPEGDEHA
jgi:polyribonucleotide nucleotidyltransferase